MPRASLANVYASCEYTTQLIFRSLPTVAKHYVLRLICLDAPLDVATVHAWCRRSAGAGAERAHDAALRAMHREFCMLVLDPPSTTAVGDDPRLRLGSALSSSVVDGTTVTLDRRFAESVRRSLQSSAKLPWEAERTALLAAKPPKKGAPAPDFINRYATRKWSSLQRYLVEATSRSQRAAAVRKMAAAAAARRDAMDEDDAAPRARKRAREGDGARSIAAATAAEQAFDVFSPKMELLLQSAKLVRLDGASKAGGSGSARAMRLSAPKRRLLTAEGCDFLLQREGAQLWVVLHEYLENQCAARGFAHDDILSFVCRLSFCVVGRGYPCAALTLSQRGLLEEFALLGFVYRVKHTSRWFYPTRLALALVQVSLFYVPLHYI